jgi:hypothetical protein
MGKLNLAAITTAISILIIPSLAYSTNAGLDALPTHAPTAPPAAHDLRRRADSSSSIVTLHLPSFDTQTILASVITANPTATSYLLTCPTDEPDDECGLGTGIEVLDGPSTLEVHITLDQYAVDVWCSLNGDTADCYQSAKGRGGLITTTTQYLGISAWALLCGSGGETNPTFEVGGDWKMYVTAGLEALTSADISSSRSATTSTAIGSSSSSSSDVSFTSTGPSGLTLTPTGTGAAQSSKISTAGMVAITGNAVVAGVAAVLGGMLVA